MSLLVIPWSTYAPFTGAGSFLTVPWYAMYPAEYGCVGDPGLPATTPGMIASVTNMARNLRARSWSDGTAWRITAMAVGVGGHDPVDPMRPIPVDPDLQTLRAETFRSSALVAENPREDSRATSFALPLSRTSYSGGVSEFGLIATILFSPIPSEVGTTFLYSVVHTGLLTKGDRVVTTLRALELV